MITPSFLYNIRPFTAFHSKDNTVKVVPSDEHLIDMLANIVNPKIAEYGVAVLPYMGVDPEEVGKPFLSPDVNRRIIASVQVNALPMFSGRLSDAEIDCGRVFRTDDSIEIALVLGPSQEDVFGAVHFRIDINRERCKILALSVFEAHQKKGYGSILLETAILLGALHGCTRVSLPLVVGSSDIFFKHGFNLKYDSNLYDSREDNTFLLDFANSSQDSIQVFQRRLCKNLKITQKVKVIAQNYQMHSRTLEWPLQNTLSLTDRDIVEHIPRILKNVSITSVIMQNILMVVGIVNRLYDEKFTELESRLLKRISSESVSPYLTRIVDQSFALRKSFRQLSDREDSRVFNKESVQRIEDKRLLLQEFELAIISLNQF